MTNYAGQQQMAGTSPSQTEGFIVHSLMWLLPWMVFISRQIQGYRAFYDDPPGAGFKPGF